MVSAAGVFTFVLVNTDSTIQVRKLIDENAEIPVENLPVWHDIAGSGYAQLYVIITQDGTGWGHQQARKVGRCLVSNCYKRRMLAHEWNQRFLILTAQDVTRLFILRTLSAQVTVSLSSGI